MKPAAFILTVLLSVVPAYAQHSHGSKGPNGGMLADAAGVHIEFLPSGNAVTFNVLNEDNKPLSTKGYTASALVVTGNDRETISLVPSGENVLKGEIKRPVTASTTITLMIKTDTGKTGQAKYKG